MKPTLKPGVTHRFMYRVPENKTVPHLYPEVAEFQAMPRVFATGYMVGLMEWACMQLMAPHLDPGEGSLGVHIDVVSPAKVNVVTQSEQAQQQLGDQKCQADCRTVDVKRFHGAPLRNNVKACFADQIDSRKTSFMILSAPIACQTVYCGSLAGRDYRVSFSMIGPW